MRKTNLLTCGITMALCIPLVGCFGSDKEATAAAESFLKNEDTPPEVMLNNGTETEMVAIPEADFTEDNATPQSQAPQYKSAELDKIRDDFFNSPVDMEIPTAAPDANGVKNVPISTSGKILLKIGSRAPSNSITYDNINMVNCDNSGDKYYCSDRFAIAVQNSKNRIMLSDGSQAILTPAYNQPAGTFILSHVSKDNALRTAPMLFSPFGESANHPVKYARVNGSACVYAQVNNNGTDESSYYQCFTPSNDPELIKSDIFFFNVDMNVYIDDIELDSLPKSSYDSFSSAIL